MRVMLDANIFISYLLHPGKEGAICSIVHAAVRGDFVLLLPEALLDEFVSKIPEKPYLAERITPMEVSRLVEIVKAVGAIIPKLNATIPAVTRDPKDDYLLAYAVVGEADYLVTGDDDLLILEQVGSLKLISPKTFASVLES